jgi:hypothetical protein
MRIILCLLAFVTSPAWAEWVKVRETKDATFYIDPATIRKDGNLRKIWEVKDFRERDTGGEMSVRFLSEYDCREERYRVLALSSHTEPMAKGHTVISGDDPSPWVTIPLDTLGKATLKRVCAK